MHNNIHKRDYREAYAPFHSEPFTEYILFTMNIHLGAEKRTQREKKAPPRRSLNKNGVNRCREREREVGMEIEGK